MKYAELLERLKELSTEIITLESIAVAKGIDLNQIKEQAKTTIFDYKTLLLNAIEKK